MPKTGDDFLSILGNGEVYISGMQKTPHVGPKAYPVPFEAAREKIRKDITEVRAQLKQLPSILRLDEVVVCFRLFPEFLAKSYYPKTLLRQSYLTDVGSRRWYSSFVPPDKQDGGDEGSRMAKMIFVRTTDDGLALLASSLDQSESRMTKTFKEEVQRLEALTTLVSRERLLGFSNDWTEGVVELVLHPFGDDTDRAVQRLQRLLAKTGVHESGLRVRSYVSGPTFVSAHLNRSGLTAIEEFNPLRTAHPLKAAELPDLRSGPSVPAPQPPSDKSRSSIIVGVFDGGVDENNPLLKGHVRLSPVSVGSQPNDKMTAHGTAVAGSVLYGPLNDYGPKASLPLPAVSVEVFRVLPPSNPRDFDLYEAIDLIERVVPQRQDIKVYNLSFGPVGPILDDDITRFTYVLDLLAWEHRVLFVVAVGNDGDRPAPEDRIQAPSDIVNGLGVGAYSYDANGQIRRAPYSSVGLGREGCKIKPDLVAFGGCDQRPIHVIGPTHGTKAWQMGTSFAAPIVSGRAAEILGRCDRVSPLVARALLVHTAEHPGGEPDRELGHGAARNSAEDILRCTQNRVTVIYQSSLRPTTYAKLRVPLPALPSFKGSVEISWTLALVSRVDQLNVDEYTEACVEDSFIPNANVYKFTSPNRKKTHNVNVVTDAATAASLLADGWARSEHPVTTPANVYKTEAQRRGEFQWDTIVYRRPKNKLYSSLHEPYLTLHAMGRNGQGIHERLDYAAIVTVSIPKYTGNLYNETLRQFNRLEPIRLKAINEILVPVL